jgi:CTP:molybdopterin cytidylyltransferase MocA
MSTLVVLLAAGAGTRFVGDTHKLRATIRGAAVLSHALLSAQEAAIGDVVVITGADTFDDLLQGVQVIHNTSWGTGQRSSVLLALDEGERRGCEAVVIAAADQPFVSPADWRAVASDPSPIAVATYEGVPSTPVRLHRSVWQQFRELPADPDAGARSLMRLHPELVSQVACKGSGADIDTTEDLQRWT